MSSCPCWSIAAAKQPRSERPGGPTGGDRANCAWLRRLGTAFGSAADDDDWRRCQSSDFA